MMNDQNTFFLLPQSRQKSTVRLIMKRGKTNLTEIITANARKVFEIRLIQ